MAEIAWESLPEVVRERVDELVVADQWFTAIRELGRRGVGGGSERIAPIRGPRSAWP